MNTQQTASVHKAEK